MEYPIKTFNKDSAIVLDIFNKNMPDLIGISYQLYGELLLEVSSDWLQGRKLTLALKNERSALLKKHRAAIPEAIAKTEAELALI
jgi:hypothetical protein